MKLMSKLLSKIISFYYFVINIKYILICYKCYNVLEKIYSNQELKCVLNLKLIILYKYLIDFTFSSLIVS